jgi:hypothetical protein
MLNRVAQGALHGPLTLVLLFPPQNAPVSPHSTEVSMANDFKFDGFKHPLPPASKTDKAVSRCRNGVQRRHSPGWGTGAILGFVYQS